jgi:hypothetical protein
MRWYWIVYLIFLTLWNITSSQRIDALEKRTKHIK